MLRFDDENKLLKLGVHDLLDAGPASGHLRMQVAWSSRTRMRIGQEIHTAWQDFRATEDSSFRREVRLSHSVIVRGWEVQIQGRVDGLSQGNERLLIEEVKSTTLPASQLAFTTWEDFTSYSRQLQLYLHFLAATGQPADGQLVLISISDNTEHRLDVPRDPNLHAYLEQQLGWIILQHEERMAWLAKRKAAASSAEGLPFPHDAWRPGQHQLAASVEGALRDSKTLLLSAPTGYGKTAAALHAALTVAYQSDKRIFFATARTTQQLMAEQVVTEMAKRGAPIRAVSIRAKEKICLNEVVACRPDACPYAVDYHDKVQSKDLLHRAWSDPPAGCTPGVPRPVAIIELAEAEQVCPFALSIDLAGQADVIIGDFNYVFDPSVRLAEIGDRLKEWIVVVDEAHNLPERAMSYGSPELSLLYAEQAAVGLQDLPDYKECAELMAEVADALSEGVDAVPHEERDGELALALEAGINADWIGEICAHVERLALEYALLKLERPRFPAGEHDPWLEVARALLRFKSALERAEGETLALWRRGPLDRSRYRRRQAKFDRPNADIPTLTQDARTGLSLLCRDPSRLLGPLFKKLAGAVCMSATLEPADFYRAMFGLDEETSTEASFPSPFPPERRQVLVVPSVSTEYRHRDRDRDQTAALISEFVAVVPGNAAVFFPSFAFREAVLPLLKLDGRPTLIQERRMSEDDRTALLETMSRGEGHVLLAVLGGIFSEGVDLPGGGLVAAAVVGPALPHANRARRLKQAWYQEQYGQGFRYAWLVPGMARVVQAAGRVIRTPEDRGSIVLIGRRFLQRDYQDFFPDDWAPERIRHLAGALNGFWRRDIPNS